MSEIEEESLDSEHQTPETSRKPRLRDKAPFRVALILLAVIAAFIIVRELTVPKSWGEYGYYRGDNVAEWASRDQNFASGNEACGTAKCHAQEVEYTAKAEHGQMNCQSCHGPLLDHVKKPNAALQKIVGNAELCGACHRQLAGRDDKIRTVQIGQHSGGLDCTRCHDPHQPWAKIRGRKW